MAWKTKTAALMLALVLLSGCWHKWYFQILGIFDGRPQFCMTRQPNCTGEGLSFSSFEIEEVPSPGEQSRTVWAITKAGDQPLRTFAYGIPPPGWKQKVAPEPLVPGKIYSVGSYWFRLIGMMGGKLKYEVAPAGKLLISPAAPAHS